MRNKFILLLFFLISGKLNASERILGIEGDKVAHALGGFTGQVICQASANLISEEGSKVVKAVSCFAIVNALGVVKEMTDPMHGGSRQMGDIYANMIGSGVAIPIVYLGF